MKSFFLGERPLNTDLAILLLRLVFGGLFVWHGWFMADHYAQYRPMAQDIIGIGAKLTYDLPMIFELVSGTLIILGFLTRLNVIPIAVIIIIAYFIAHEKDPFMMKTFPFILMCLAPVVFILGSGKYSLDHLLFNNKFSKYANG
jgi:putative oxidoreductase